MINLPTICPRTAVPAWTRLDVPGAGARRPLTRFRWSGAANRARGGWWIRTTVAFATVLQTAPIGRSGNPPKHAAAPKPAAQARIAARGGYRANGYRRRAGTSRTGHRTARTGDTVAANPSFDVVSKVDRQEVDNALNQAEKELTTRFDFRGTGAQISWAGEEAVTLQAETEDRVRAALEVFKEKLVKRHISLKALDASDPRPSGKAYKIEVKIIQGIDSDKARAIGKKIRDEGPKGVQAQIQGDQLRVSGKKKDDLQDVIALLKNSDFGIALQFTNYR